MLIKHTGRPRVKYPKVWFKLIFFLRRKYETCTEISTINVKRMNVAPTAFQDKANTFLHYMENVTQPFQTVHWILKIITLKKSKIGSYTKKF